MQRCNSKTKAGTPCGAPAGLGGQCFFHANPDRAHTLGRIGGLKNRFQLLEPPPAASLSVVDLRDILAEAIRDVRSKKITPRTAGAVSQLCNSLHRVLQSADLETRLHRLEQQLTERDVNKGGDMQSDNPRTHNEIDVGMDPDTGDPCGTTHVESASTENGTEPGEDEGS